MGVILMPNALSKVCVWMYRIGFIAGNFTNPVLSKRFLAKL